MPKLLRAVDQIDKVDGDPKCSKRHAKSGDGASMHHLVRGAWVWSRFVLYFGVISEERL